MSVRSSRLPKLRNDGLCHAVLENQKRCPNPTFLKSNGQYSKWCLQHTTKCSRLNKDYKSSCANFDYMKCGAEDSFDTASTKLYALNNCYKDRLNFEKKCIHESKRDEGHRIFVENLLSDKEVCQEIVKELKPVKKTQSVTPRPSENEITILALDKMITVFAEMETNPKETKESKVIKQSKETKESKEKKTKLKKKTNKPVVVETKKDKEDDFLNTVLPTQQPQITALSVPEQENLSLIYKMNEQEKKIFKNTLTKTLRNIPDVRERLRVEIDLIEKENKARSYNNVKKHIFKYLAKGRELIQNFIELFINSDLTIEELTKFKNIVDEFNDKINHLHESVDAVTESNFDANKFDEIYKEYYSLTKAGTKFSYDLSKLNEIIARRRKGEQ